MKNIRNILFLIAIHNYKYRNEIAVFSAFILIQFTIFFYTDLTEIKEYLLTKFL